LLQEQKRKLLDWINQQSIVMKRNKGNYTVPTYGYTRLTDTDSDSVQ